MTINQQAAGASNAAAGPNGQASTPMPTGIGSITFSGIAFSHDDVANWLDALGKEKGFTYPYFSNSASQKLGQRTVMKFASTVTVTDAALSGRYTKPAGS